MDFILEFFESILEGNLKYALGLFLGALALVILATLYGRWKKRESEGDKAYIMEHQDETAASLKKKAGRIVVSLMVVLVVVMPLGMFMVVQVFSDNETIGPELPMLLILLIFLLSLGFTIVQAFRLKRTRRRIKLLDEK